MSRHESVIERVEKKLIGLGYTKKDRFLFDKNGYGDFGTFFDFLVDLKLAGITLESINKEKIWESMKSQMNYLESCLVKATDDHRKLENEVRHLKKEKEELIRQLSGR